MPLIVHGEDRVLGRIRIEGGTLHGTNKGVQGLADAAVRRNGGDVQAAYADLRGQTNGYITVTEEGEHPATAATPRMTWAEDDLDFGDAAQ